MPTEGCMCPIMTNIPKVQIDKEGTFKYILVNFHCPTHEIGVKPCVTIVWGGRRYKYHSDIYLEVSNVSMDVDPDCRVSKYNSILLRYAT